ncbi:hypothetical protein RUM43_008063 [Polyplax serrata]|uniref:Uncharacterized protein n=1 Tax=Polyplax serrata TaxID=468196 RepID=A0AAN8PN06_POLSC
MRAQIVTWDVSSGCFTEPCEIEDQYERGRPGESDKLDRSGVDPSCKQKSRSEKVEARRQALRKDNSNSSTGQDPPDPHTERESVKKWKIVHVENPNME